MSRAGEEVNLASIAEIFTPVSLDVGPLHEFLLTLAKQVEKVQSENAALKERIDELELEARLETIEGTLAEVQQLPFALGADGATVDGAASPRLISPAHRASLSPRIRTPQSMLGMPPQSPPLVPGGLEGGAVSSPVQGMRQGLGTQADAGWILHEFSLVKDRLAIVEQMCSTEKQGEQHSRVTEELKAQQAKLEIEVKELHEASASSTEKLNVLGEGAMNHEELIQGLKDKLGELEAKAKRAKDDNEDAALKNENNTNQIWDQIRHVENSLSQRMTLAETSQVNMLQEVDETKETSLDVMARVEELRRHAAALESKLESFNSQVAAAIQPLHTSLSQVSSKLEDVNRRKQDASSAVTMDDVSVAVSRAVDHADRRADNIIKSIGAMEGRVEELNDLKANKSSVVMTTDLEVLLKEHAGEIDSHMLELKKEIFNSISTKADKEELSSLDTKLGARVGALEGALLKGLKAISDKVSAALSEKLDLTRFNEFKIQVRAVLADVEDRLQDLSPFARGMKVPLNGAGALGASSCLCCDTRVRSVKEMHGTGPIGSGTGTLSSSHKVFMADRLPSVEGLLPSITANKTSPEVGSYNNFKASLQRKREAAEHVARSAGSAGEMYHAHQSYMESPTPQFGTQEVGGFIMGAQLTFPGSAQSGSRRGSAGTAGTAGQKLGSISGAISEGRIPNTRGKGGPPGSEKPEKSERPPLPIPQLPDSPTTTHSLLPDQTALPAKNDTAVDAGSIPSTATSAHSYRSPSTQQGGAAQGAMHSFGATAYPNPEFLHGDGDEAARAALAAFAAAQPPVMSHSGSSRYGSAGSVTLPASASWDGGPDLDRGSGASAASLQQQQQQQQQQQEQRRSSSAAGSVADFPVVEAKRHSTQSSGSMRHHSRHEAVQPQA